MDKLLDKLPDVYFDWYARVLPGIISIIYYFYITNATFNNCESNLFLYAVISYVAGHSVQPISSFCVRKLNKFYKTDESVYKKARMDNSLYSLTNKVSKAYAESVGMVSTAILLFIIFAFYILHLIPTGEFTCDKILISIISILFFIFSSIERILARKRKIEDLM